MLSIIAAIDEENALGNKGKIPWKNKEDLNFFKEQTLDKNIIMGRKTFESLPKQLEKRNHYILTQDKQFKNACQHKVLSSKEDALQLFQKGTQEHFIIGGAEIYKLFFDKVKFLYINHIPGKWKADCYFPEIHLETWEIVEEIPFNTFTFKKYKKRNDRPNS